MPRAPGSILLVEHDADLRDTLTEVLSSAGFAVASAAHGNEALGWLREHPRPALVLLDLWMPRREGWALLEHLHVAPGGAPPVVGLTSAAARHPALTATLPKPFDEEALLDLVRRVLGAAS